MGCAATTRCDGERHKGIRGEEREGADEIEAGEYGKKSTV